MGLHKFKKPKTHPELVCVLIREMGSEARASPLKPQVRSLASTHRPLRTSASARAGAIERGDVSGW